MKRYTSQPGASLTCFVVAFGMVLAAGSAVAQLVIVLSARPRNPCRELHGSLGEIKDQDLGPSVRIHGDGYVVVHCPRYMK
jgi:hypothetical protein